MNRERLHFALPRPVPRGLWRRVPPAIFPPILGGLGLALAWRAGIQAFSLPPALAELLAGMIVAVALFCLTAYAGKLLRRPSVLRDELAILPGRAGTAAAVLSLYLLAALLGPTLGRPLLVVTLALHLGLLAALLRIIRRGPAELRQVNPVWHQQVTGLIVAAQVAVALGWPALASWLLWPSALAALVIYALSARQLLRTRVPAPLRPLLAIHLAPFALFGSVALGLGWEAVGIAIAWLAFAVLLGLAVSARWLLAAGFSPFWGALTFPIAATAGLWVMVWRAEPSDLHRMIAGALLIAATLVVLPILFAVLRSWAQGRLPVKTNAAIA